MSTHTRQATANSIDRPRRESLRRHRVQQRDCTSVRRLTAEMVRIIMSQFQPEKVVLFGSRARGDATGDSDVGLLVVMPVTGSKRERQLEVRIALHDVHFPKDIIVVTPDEWKTHHDIPGTIVRAAHLEGEVLFERNRGTICGNSRDRRQT